MNKNILFVTLATIVCAWITSCSSEEDFGNTSKEKKLVNMVSTPMPIQLTKEQRTFVNDNNCFTLKFLNMVNDATPKDKSFIYSPLSITYVLGMVNDAAEGTTRKELEQTLGFHEGGIKAVNEYCKKLIDGLPKVDEKVQLNIANAIFLNNKYTMKKQFQEDMKTYFDAQAEALDFSSSNTVTHINDWCNNKTQGMIPKIIDKVEPATVSCLLNAIYFKADWTSKFDTKNTKTETFSTEKGTTEIPMMHQNVLISYIKNDIYSGIVMPYGNGYWNMTILLPEEGKTIEDITNLLAGEKNNSEQNNSEQYQTYPSVFYANAHACEVDLILPRYETNSDTNNLDGNLINLLNNMGIRQVFNSQSAEIPNLCNEGNVFISMMRQKAAIKVNEEGSEAAAVTIGEVNFTTANPMEYPKATFHANRPFVYLIGESSSGVILFVGKFTGD